MIKKLQDSKPSKWLRIFLPAVIVVVWLGLAGVGGPYFGRVEEVSSNDQASFLPASSDAAEVQQLLKQFRSDETIPAIILFNREDGVTSADLAYTANLGDSLKKLDGLAGGLSPAIVAEDKQAVYVVAPIASSSEVSDVIEEINREVLASKPSGLDSYITGPAGFSSDLKAAFAGIDGTLLLVAVGAVFAILLVVYRSPLLPFIVLFTSIFALSASILVIWWLAYADIVALNGQVQGILFILVIGAATDYSLLYVARYREELRQSITSWQATKKALRASFEPIVASGGTVIVGLLCLLFSDLNSNKALGPVGAIGILLSIASALTLLPALLLLFGRVSFWPFRPAYDAQAHATLPTDSKGVWPRIARAVSHRPRLIWVSAMVILVAFAVGATQLKATGVSQSDLILGESQARIGQEKLGEHFPDGAGSPATIIGSASKQDELVAALQIEGVTAVSALAKESPSGSIPLGNNAPTAGPFASLSPTVSQGKIALQATLSDAADSPEAEATIGKLRQAVERVDTTAIVGGITAIAVDTNAASIHDRNIIIPIVLVAITVILMLLLRAVLIPILLMFTTVVSFATALGVSALVFNGIFGFPGADPSVPLYAFVFLVALGIDYNIFLMTRVREETIKYGTKEGVLRGLVATGGIITSAGIVLAATFAALAVIPILFLVQLAFIVALGVLLDTLLVRALLVPALIRDMGSIVWWPSKLTSKK